MKEISQILRILIFVLLLIIVVLTASDINKTKNSFNNKSAIFLGDSVSYGNKTNGNGFGYYINELENFKEFTNAAVNTATLNTNTQGDNNIIEQIRKNKDNQYDFVIIEGGYGDLRDVPYLGILTKDYDSSKLDTTTFAGAIEYTLYLATTTWEGARIGFIVGYDVPNSKSGIRDKYEETQKYWNVAKAACDKWKVNYLDLFEGTVNYDNKNEKFSDFFDVRGNKYLANDNIHPTEEGYKRIAPVIKDWMKKIPSHKKIK